MELYVGGLCQGKLDYVRTLHLEERLIVLEGEEMNPSSLVCEKGERILVNHLHLWIRRMLEQGMDAWGAVEAIVSRHPDVIFLCDEIGNGIVPMEQFQREYREAVGRICVRLAAQAERVERVICGMGQRLK